MSESHDIKSEKAKYYKVFGALLIFTLITVALKSLQVGIALAITLALIVATIKASLVASFFMHLIAEKKSVYLVLIFTVIFFVGMIFLTLGSFYSVPEGTVNLNLQYAGKLNLHGNTHGSSQKSHDSSHQESEH